MDILAQGFVLGAVGGIVPGAVLTILLVSALQGGLRTGMAAFWWAMLSEIIVAGGLLFIATLLPISGSVFAVIGLLGGVVLLYFASQVFRLRAVTVNTQTVAFTAPKILLLSATNAPLYIFWTTICFPLIWQLSSSWGLPAAALSYFVLFELGWGISTFVMLALFVFSRGTLSNERVMHMVFAVIALILGLFGVRMFITSILLLF